MNILGFILWTLAQIRPRRQRIAPLPARFVVRFLLLAVLTNSENPEFPLKIPGSSSPKCSRHFVLLILPKFGIPNGRFPSFNLPHHGFNTLFPLPTPIPSQSVFNNHRFNPPADLSSRNSNSSSSTSLPISLSAPSLPQVAESFKSADKTDKQRATFPGPHFPLGPSDGPRGQIGDDHHQHQRKRRTRADTETVRPEEKRHWRAVEAENPPRGGGGGGDQSGGGTFTPAHLHSSPNNIHSSVRSSNFSVFSPLLLVFPIFSLSPSPRPNFPFFSDFGSGYKSNMSDSFPNDGFSNGGFSNNGFGPPNPPRNPNRPPRPSPSNSGAFANGGFAQGPGTPPGPVPNHPPTLGPSRGPLTAGGNGLGVRRPVDCP